MRKEDGHTNIFDLAAHQPRKTPARKNTPTRPKSPEETHTSETHTSPPVNPEEVAQMIEKMHQLHKDLQEKLETTYETYGLNKHDIKQLIKVVSAEDRQKLQKEKQELEEKVWGVLGEEARQHKLKKEKERLIRIKKAKAGGGRQKWIPTK